jgi:dTMP kinase
MAKDLKEKLAGKFIVFDGPDGCGKSTQRERCQAFLIEQGIDVVVARDPGGTAIGDKIRQILLGDDLHEMDVRCETFLFMASRAQLVGKVIEPAIESGKTVLCDRFISSTCAYQGAQGYDMEKVIEVGRYAVGQTWPDLTIILDVPVDQGFERAGRKTKTQQQEEANKHAVGQGMLFEGARSDAMESRHMSFHKKVRAIFKSLPASFPGRIEVVDASGPLDEVSERVMEVVRHADF